MTNQPNPFINSVPYVLEKSEGRERYWDLYSRLNKDRIIMLGSEINDRVANLIVAQLLYLDKKSHDEDIYLYINSPGGVITSGLAIYDTMQYIKSDVQTIALGQAASMAAVLLAAGAKGKRFCLPNTGVMVHQPRGGAQGQASDIEIQAERVVFLKRRLVDIMAKHTGQDATTLVDRMDRDFWMTADEAVTFGIVDKVFGND
jgi:ATP-dependent Clp protease protease subunit